jgi:membrane-associated protease RseP (regulator of RpoE activity)
MAGMATNTRAPRPLEGPALPFLLILSLALLAGAPLPGEPRWLGGMRLEAREGRVVASRIVPGSPADRSGLKAGDTILIIGDQAVVDLRTPSPKEILDLVDRLHGDNVRIVVGRGAGAFGVLLPLRGVGTATTDPLRQHPETGQVAPEFEGRALDGSAVSLKAFRGRPVLIDFWASWCPPCRDSALSVRRLGDQYGDRLAIIGVSLDEDRRDYEAFVFNRHMPGAQIHDGGPRGPIGALYGAAASGLPYAVLVSAEGTVVATGRTPADLEPSLERLLASAEGASR